MIKFSAAFGVKAFGFLQSFLSSISMGTEVVPRNVPIVLLFHFTSENFINFHPFLVSQLWACVISVFVF